MYPETCFSSNDYALFVGLINSLDVVDGALRRGDAYDDPKGGGSPKGLLCGGWMMIG